MIKYFTFFLMSLLFASCYGNKEKPVYYDNSAADIETDSVVSDSDTYSDSDDEISSDYEQMSDDDIVSIPFTEKNGVKYVNVSVNGFGFEMIFDTGCSGTLISVAEANYLYEKGYLTEDDIMGVTQSQIADGSIVEDMVINLKEVIIDGKITCPNVTATVSSNNNAPLLLGNEVLNRVAAYAVDNENQTINFKLK